MPPATRPADSTEARQRAKTAARGLTQKIMWAALLGALVFAALALYSDLPKMQAAARSFELNAFLWGLLLAAVNYLLRIVRWNRYLQALDIHVPRVESGLIFLSGFVMSVTPGKVGEVFKSLLLHESRQVPFVRSAPIVIAERLTDLVALVLLTALGCLAFPSGPAVAAAGAVVVGAMVLLVSHRGLAEWALSLWSRLPLIGASAKRLREAYESLHRLTRVGPMVSGTLLACVAWGMECGSLYLIARGFEGVELDLASATFAYAASTIVGALAMMPGGLGVTEVGMTGLLQTLGSPSVTPAIASATTIMVRVATLWFAVLVGAIALALYRTTRTPGAPQGEAQSPGGC